MNVEDLRKALADFEKFLSFEDVGEFLKVSTNGFIPTEQWNAVNSQIKELEGAWISNGKWSHWKIPKKQKDPEVLEDPHVKMDRAIKNIVAAWRELNPE